MTRIHMSHNRKLRASQHIYRRGDVKTGKEGPPYIKVECDCGERFEFRFDADKRPAAQVITCVNPSCRATQSMDSLWADRLPGYVDWSEPR